MKMDERTQRIWDDIYARVFCHQLLVTRKMAPDAHLNAMSCASNAVGRLLANDGPATDVEPLT